MIDGLASAGKMTLIFAAAPLLPAVCLHALLPRRALMLVAVLVLVEIVLVIPAWLHAVARSGPEPGDLAVAGMVIGLVAGNLIAVPAARRLRSLFNASVKQ